ncbi:MAG: hypothetical protein PHH26_06075 [Candidatus Thermoplasmatota archaeon]|nr:hypothetical protein [Candidatus Thermoplasmatota archaeon]
MFNSRQRLNSKVFLHSRLKSASTIQNLQILVKKTPVYNNSYKSKLDALARLMPNESNTGWNNRHDVSDGRIRAADERK